MHSWVVLTWLAAVTDRQIDRRTDQITAAYIGLLCLHTRCAVKNESKTGFCFHAVFCNRLRLMREKYAKKVSAIANERARRNRAVEDLDNHCDKLAVNRKGRFCQVISNSHRHDRHDTDGTVLSCLMWRCELCRPDRQTGAFCVRYASECVGRWQRSRSSQHSRQGICERGLTVHCACPTIDK